MIIFDLQCANVHPFEGWFEDLEDFKSQAEKKYISCPVCGDTTISRMPSVFAIKGAHRPSASPYHGENMGEIIHKISEYIENNFDNVGSNFASEALKIHYGVAEPRNIRGISTKAEEKLLKDEGVQVLKFPVPNRQATES